ncbi:MAG: M1 family peptidase [Desulfuromonadales bacterium]|nr:M1 family peptidase [Desulfuromonadales bacterium]
MPNYEIHIFQPVTEYNRRHNRRFAENPAAVYRIFYTCIILLASLLLLVFSVHPGSAAPKSLSTVIDYHLYVDLHSAKQNLSATATILLPPTEQPVTLKLVSQANISHVELDGVPAAYSFDGSTLTIPALFAAKEQQTRLTIRYKARFADSLPVETIGIEDPSFGVGAAIHPEGTYLSAGTPWFPQAAGHRGRHHVRVSAPAGVIAVTAGRLVETVTRDSRTITRWENDFPLEGLALAAGRLELARDELDGIQLLTFLSPENSALAPGYLAAMRRHLTFYRDLLGPYPYPKFAVVENFLPTGYGMPSWTLLGKSVVRLPFLLDTSLPHEIVHSWWGNAVEVDYAQGNWAEGLTTYLADYLLKERANPGEALEYRRKLLRDYAALVTTQNDFPLTAFSGRMTKYQQAIGYGKGAMVFHMLRRSVGDTSFQSALRHMAAEGNGQELGWSDIERIFNEESGMNLRWFFAQWVEQKGAPELILDEVRSGRSAKGWTVSGLVRQTGGIYRLDLPLILTGTKGESLSQTVALTGMRTPFRFESSTAPSVLGADPDSDLFRRLSPLELPAAINDLLAPRQPLVVVADGQQGLLEAGRDLLKGLHWESAGIVEEKALDAAALAGRDLLLFGWPRRAELRPPLPDELAISANDGAVRWNVDGQPPQSDTLFTVLAGRNNPDGVRAVFLSSSPELARAVATKISHYGRYSLLLFTAGRNTAKMTWKPKVSPLQVVFPKESQP